MVVEMVVTVQGFDEAQRRLRAVNHNRIVRGSKFFARKRMEESVERVRTEAPVGETERLASSIDIDIQDKGDSIIGNLVATAPHAQWVHKGTGEFGPTGQAFVPRNRLVMVFFKEGKWIRTRKVRGQPANPFLSRGARIIRDKIASTLPREVRKDIQILIGGNS